MGATAELREALKQTFFPFMEGKGFIRDRSQSPLTTSFRRMTPESVQVCEIQWDKYGKPRFAIIFGTSTPPGLAYNGERLAHDAIFPWNTQDNGTLQPCKGASSRHWFRQDKSFLAALLSGQKLYPPAKIVAQVIALFPELEAYWESRVCGPHLHLHRHLP